MQKDNQLKLTESDCAKPIEQPAHCFKQYWQDLLQSAPDAHSRPLITNIDNGGLKYDQDKPPIDLIPSESIIEIAKVLGFGAKKYERHNWKKGISYSRLIAAALRHVLAYNGGEDLDPESQLSHISHAQCCLAFLSTFIAEGRKELDDRYKKVSK